MASRRCNATLYARMKTRRPAVLALRMAWIAIILWYEIGTFVRAVRSCPWPDQRRAPLPDSRLSRILIIADPQVLDYNAYPGRHPVLVRLSRVVADLYLRKSWRTAMRYLQPNAVVFLGDMMDNGRVAMSRTEYDVYYQRFRHIFKIHGEQIPVYYVPGNHDIGIGNSFALDAPVRYASSFGAQNHRIGIANHTLLFLDAPTLVDEDYTRMSSGKNLDDWPGARHGPIEFVHAQAQERDHPVVLFSHIPLARGENVYCGRFREGRRNIRQGQGLGYQNTLGKEVSEWVLKRLRPTIIFSGDDHDYCEVTHTLSYTDSNSITREQTVQEVTVKSFSMVMGVRRPGYQLLSLSAHVPEPELLPQIPQLPPAHSPCTLPDQLGIYLFTYAPLVVLSILLLLFTNVQRIRRQYGRDRLQSRTRVDWAYPNELNNHEHHRKETPPPQVNGRRRSGETIDEDDVDLVFVNPEASLADEPSDKVDKFKLFTRRGTIGLGREPLNLHFEHEDESEKGRGLRPTLEEETELEAEMDVLPEPATRSRSSKSSRESRLTWTFVLGGQVRRLSVSWPFGGGLRGRGFLGRQKFQKDDRGFVMGILKDVLDVAWPALIVFLVVNCLVML